MNPDHTLVCPGCFAHLQPTAIGYVVFGGVGFIVGSLVAVVALALLGTVAAEVLAAPFACAFFGATLLNPLELVPDDRTQGHRGATERNRPSER